MSSLLMAMLRSADIIHLNWLEYIVLRAKCLPLCICASVFFDILLKLQQVRGAFVVYTLHNILPHSFSHMSRRRKRLVYIIFRTIICHADCLVAHTERSKRLASRFYGVSPEKITVIKMLSITVGCKTNIKSDLIDRLVEKSAGRICLTMFGSLSDYKGFETAVRCAEKTIDLCPNLFFVFAGRYNGSDLKRIQQINEMRNCMLINSFIDKATLSGIVSQSDIGFFPYNEFVTTSGTVSLLVGHRRTALIPRQLSFAELYGENVFYYRHRSESDLLSALKEINTYDRSYIREKGQSLYRTSYVSSEDMAKGYRQAFKLKSSDR